MLKGACREAPEGFSPDILPETPLNLKQKRVLCYYNWRKIYGLPLDHLLENYVEYITCESHITDCPTEVYHPLIYKDMYYEREGVYNEPEEEGDGEEDERRRRLKSSGKNYTIEDGGG